MLEFEFLKEWSAGPGEELIGRLLYFRKLNELYLIIRTTSGEFFLLPKELKDQISSQDIPDGMRVKIWRNEQGSFAVTRLETGYINSD